MVLALWPDHPWRSRASAAAASRLQAARHSSTARPPAPIDSSSIRDLALDLDLALVPTPMALLALVEGSLDPAPEDHHHTSQEAHPEPRPL